MPFLNSLVIPGSWLWSRVSFYFSDGYRNLNLHSRLLKPPGRLSLPSLPSLPRSRRRRFLMYNHSQLELTCPFSIGINFSTHQLVFTFIRLCQLSNFIFAFLHISNIILAFLPISYLPIFVSTGRPPFWLWGKYFSIYKNISI